MHPNAALVARFYRAFDDGDADAMLACYHPDVSFEDPVFGKLRGEEAGAMWRMLVGRATDLRVEARDVVADDAGGSATWTAAYAFGPTGRRVRNVIRARFAFRDGLIREHRDRFSLWRWAGMALGPVGWAAGWAPPLRARVRRDARRQLARFARKDGPR
jgi:ketosteroid isomerase-like protein